MKTKPTLNFTLFLLKKHVDQFLPIFPLCLQAHHISSLTAALARLFINAIKRPVHKPRQRRVTCSGPVPLHYLSSLSSTDRDSAMKEDQTRALPSCEWNPQQMTFEANIGWVVDLSHSSQEEPASFFILPVRNQPMQYLIDGELLSATPRVAVAVVGAPEVLVQVLLAPHIVCESRLIQRCISDHCNNKSKKLV